MFCCKKKWGIEASSLDNPPPPQFPAPRWYVPDKQPSP